MVKVTKERLHHLIDQLPESELHTAERFLEYLRDISSDPVVRALLRAPFDDEPETPEELEVVRKAKEDMAAGRVVSHEELSRRLLGDA